MRGCLVEEEMVVGLERKLAGLACEVRFGERLAPYTTFQVGGPADAFALPKDEAELVELIARCRAEGLRMIILGGGANTLIRDGGIRGVVICLVNGFREIGLVADDALLVEAGAGVKIPQLVRFAADRGLDGVECLAGVPGTVGGALAMNAGTAERFVGESVESIRWARLSGGMVETLPASRLTFIYREARFPEPGVVTAVRFRLRRGDAEALRVYLKENAALRRERQPWGVPCAGSIFRNPPGERAGRLIEAAGLKGRRVGGAEVSRVHANFLVNRGGATAADVLELIGEVQARVREAHGLDLELELKIVGEDVS
ncbi:MAG: UDP-N-acetylmuramate dehydrogenase [Candidatus Tectomicrobia bacterium]|nr:UDP-N-acetylmuramate dehydrogenase [Candidatus Tectomicrobia bacterium]